MRGSDAWVPADEHGHHTEQGGPVLNRANDDEYEDITDDEAIHGRRHSASGHGDGTERHPQTSRSNGNRLTAANGEQRGREEQRGAAVLED